MFIATFCALCVLEVLSLITLHSFCFFLIFLRSFLIFAHNQERKLRKKIHNRLLEIQGNIRVLCRIRPILDVERRSGEDVDVTEVPNEEELYVQRDQQVCFEFFQSVICLLCSLSI